ncbi:protein MAIN-LIKE 2-like [Panicum virgatum]|uniref:protein MAIN-LIKE 2-like n=1 Tax=Panicum virgatum TaxID=38727 RepID=UPI0019D518DD|nr:protein MAIN-LIKE 2-like [Panicum virgatum]
MADPARRPRDRAPRFQFDMSLLAALLDRWRPETHTFHLPVGEMTTTLQDVAMLLGLPCAGRTVGAEDVGLSWRDDLLAWFAGVQRNELAFPYRPLPANHAHGPTKRWLLQFSADYMRADADDFTVARHFEAYLLWLFGWVMFCSSQGDSCPKQLIPLARSIADAPLHEVPQFSWGSAVLAATYRGSLHGRDEGLSRGAHFCWVSSTVTALVVRALSRR